MTTLKSYENFLFSQLERAAAKMSLKESDQKDTVTLDIPLLIRILELVREDIKDDASLHRVVERMLDLKNKGPLTMDHYDYIAGKVESNKPEAIPAREPELEDIRKLAGL